MSQQDPSTSPGQRRRGWRKLLLDLHLYGGLIVSPYLVLYGVSSLQFNHPADWMSEPRATVEWERAVTPPTLAEDSLAAQAVRDELGLFGWVLPWTLAREDAGHLSFDVARPGKQYNMRLDVESESVSVVETRSNIWALNKILHGLGRVPATTFLKLWWIFTWFSVVVVVYSALTGVYLWFVSKRDRTFGWATVTAAVVSFASLVALLVA